MYDLADCECRYAAGLPCPVHPEKANVREKNVERRLVQKCKARGWWCLKLDPLHFAGIPDRLILGPDRLVVFVETKAKHGELRKRQVRVITQLRDFGFDVYVPHTRAEIDILMESINDRSHR